MNVTITRKVELTQYITIYDTTDEIIKNCIDDIYSDSIDFESLSTTGNIEYDLDLDSEEILDVVLVCNYDTNEEYEPN